MIGGTFQLPDSTKGGWRISHRSDLILAFEKLLEICPGSILTDFGSTAKELDEWGLWHLWKDKLAVVVEEGTALVYFNRDVYVLVEEE